VIETINRDPNRQNNHNQDHPIHQQLLQNQHRQQLTYAGNNPAPGYNNYTAHWQVRASHQPVSGIKSANIVDGNFATAAGQDMQAGDSWV